jgi:molybdopterin-synthase adenylyltransferase
VTGGHSQAAAPGAHGAAADPSAGTTAAGDDGLGDAELLRYSRHILLPEVGIEGQRRLLNSHALVVGAGGLGSPALMFLASAGVGRITLVDGDTVELSNLQRQLAHSEAQLGQTKVASAAHMLHGLNSQVELRPLALRAEGENLQALVREADVVLDCTDNFASRQAINRACVAARKPLVSAAAVGFDGQLSVFDVNDAASPCYACVFPEDAAFEDTACATMGVFAPLVGLVGSAQAAEALKLLCGIGSSLQGRLWMLDARRMHAEHLLLARDGACPVCASRRENLAG